MVIVGSESVRMLLGQVTPPSSIDWRVWILPAGFILLCIGYYGGLWYYRMRIRGRRLASVARELGGVYKAGLDRTTTNAVPQLEGSQLRLARSAYNTAVCEIDGRRVWMGDSGTQLLRDPLVSAIGGDTTASFVAVESPRVRNAVIIDLAFRAEQQRARLRIHGAAGAIRNFGEALLDMATRRGMAVMKSGDRLFDREFKVAAETSVGGDAILNPRAMAMLMESRPGHIWIKDGVAMLDCGTYAWAGSEFVAKARWLCAYVQAVEEFAPAAFAGHP